MNYRTKIDLVSKLTQSLSAVYDKAYAVLYRSILLYCVHLLFTYAVFSCNRHQSFKMQLQNISFFLLFKLIGLGEAESVGTAASN
jgi:hypothetical protein